MMIRAEVENILADMTYNIGEFDDDSLSAAERIEIATDRIMGLGGQSPSAE